MSSKSFIIATMKPFYSITNDALCRKYPEYEFLIIESDSEITSAKLALVNPKYIFFVHWSNIIPEAIYEKYNCIVFHMTDLPFGRGGSPLQNLISKGIYETKISAIQCVKELDAGPIYLKSPLSLHGNAEEIYMRTSKTITKMIEYIIENEPEAIPQSGEVTTFSRRKKTDGNISDLKGLEEVFDYIRMLDAEGYPRAFIEIGKFRLEFERSSLKLGEIHADVRIRLKEEG